MKVLDLKVNHIKNPLGYMIDKPTFTWRVEGAKGKFQKEAQVKVSKDKDFKDIVYDSKKSAQISSLGFTPEMNLEARTRYYWKVEVWDDFDNHGISDVEWFETGKIDEEWVGKWVTTPFEKNVHPYIVKSLHIPDKIKSARAYVSGLGLYELEVNGEKAGKEYLAPFYNDYNEWVQYQTIDITDLLAKGDNVVGAILGNGWYKGRFGFIEELEELYGDKFAFICELDISLENGERIVVGTDESWLCHPSPIIESSIYNGEIYDANKEVEGWSTVNGDTSGFENVKLINPTWGPLQERLSPPLVITERIKPVELITTPAGEKVLDFGQVLTGWIRFNCDLPKGTKVFIQHGELLQGGNFYNENLRTAKAEYTYISKGKPVCVRPYFTFYGFRYAKIEGIENINLDDFEACVIHSDLDYIGSIKTSNEKVNRLFANAFWSQRGNFLDVPTDCPQRDERMGWTGDAQVFAATSSFNMYTPAFFHKYLYDMYLEQKNLSGSVPFVVPDALGQINKISGRNEDHHGSCAWADAATVIPWVQYLFYGDKALLEKHFKNMTAWVDYIKSIDEEHCGGRRLWEHGFHFADWLALDNPDKTSRFGGTNPYYIASAYYYYSSWLTAKAAQVLWKDEEKAYYQKLSQEVKQAIQSKYFPNGDITEDTQTAMVLALYMDFVPEKHRDKLVARLKQKLEDSNIHLTTGFVGTPYLCPALSDNGLNEYAYTLLLNEDFPSWLYEVNMGATTIWERWNSVLPDGYVSDTGMNSMNHYAYGSIVEWMYRYMCGINPVESAPGFKEAIIKPLKDNRFNWVESEYLSAAGLYRSSWKIEEDKTVYKVSVPFNAKAKFVLTDKGSQVLVNGEKSKELMEDSELVLYAGDYEIHVLD